MNSTFFTKLAKTNLKNNKTNYIPYILSCIICIVMYYNMHTLSQGRSLEHIPHASSMSSMFSFGTTIIQIFSIIFLFYTNSFLIKRRKKELGLYNILGLEKRHIAIVLTIETIMIALTVLVCGLGIGILFNKVIFMILMRLLHFNVSIPFIIEGGSVLSTIGMFLLILLLTLIYNLLKVQLSNPIELLKGGQTGEKEPKASVPVFLLGIITMGIGYYLALTIEDPLAALTVFFVAVILVIVGTYCLFTAGSIFILKKLKKNPGIYYKPKNFVTISGMIYRMKQNAAGLASICILSSMVLVTLSTTFSLYIAQEDTLLQRFPNDIEIRTSPKAAREFPSDNERLLQKYNITTKNFKSYSYGTKLGTLLRNDNIQPTDSLSDAPATVVLLNIDDYNQITGTDIMLPPNHTLVYATKADLKDTIQLGNQTLTIQEQLNEFPIDSEMSTVIPSQYYIVVNHISDFTDFLGGTEINHLITYDIDGDENQINAYVSALSDLNPETFRVTHRDAYREGWYADYGCFLFLGIFIGILFIMATTLIIYYKQISEGYDDRERFQIMQKVGMNKSEVKGTINTQILTIFFIPLVTAFVHTVVVFPMMRQLLLLFGLTNTPLIAGCTAGIALAFMVVYMVIYRLTAKPYYKLVQY